MDKGYDVIFCKDGPCALSMVSAASFDIVLTDYQVPGMDGAEVIRRMRQQHVHAYFIGISVIDREKVFLEAGADRFILKEQLLAALATTIDAQAKPSAG